MTILLVTLGRGLLPTPPKQLDALSRTGRLRPMPHNTASLPARDASCSPSLKCQRPARGPIDITAAIPLMGQNRVELLTPSLSEKCSNRLSYWPEKKGWDRAGSAEVFLPSRRACAFRVGIRRGQAHGTETGSATGNRPHRSPLSSISVSAFGLDGDELALVDIVVGPRLFLAERR